MTLYIVQISKPGENQHTMPFSIESIRDKVAESARQRGATVVTWEARA